MHLLVFEIGRMRCAVPVTDVREVVRAVEILPLPDAPALVEGVVTVHGTLVPVIDLRRRLGLAAKPLDVDEHLILLDLERQPSAVRADAALEVIRAPSPRGDESSIAGPVPDVVLVHDLRLLSDAEHRQLERGLAGAAESELANGPQAVDAREVLRQRAQRLAAKAPPPDPPATLDVLTFALGSVQYAIETRYVREVMRLADLTPVPGTPDVVAGITNYRGQVLCLFDVRRLLGVPSIVLHDLSTIIVLGTDEAELGVLADRLDDTRRLVPEAVLAIPHLDDAPAGGLNRGITREGITVLDGRQLLHDPRLTIEFRNGSIRVAE